MDGRSNAPIIIKRKKVIAGGGHHGGAWKVAYADFVTAMMAFFMLMWLLNATTEQQRKGLADYFSPTIAVNRVSGGGDGALNGDDIVTRETMARSGDGGVGIQNGVELVDRPTAQDAAESRALEQLEAVLLGMGGESTVMQNALQHIVTRLTDEGLVIEMFDLPGAPLFVDDTAEPQPVTVEIAQMLSRILRLVTNNVAVTGHVKLSARIDATTEGWGLSFDRANQTRQLLVDTGFLPDRFTRVTGKSSTDPILTDETADRNNRIEIIVLRSSQSSTN